MSVRSENVFRFEEKLVTEGFCDSAGKVAESREVTEPINSELAAGTFSELDQLDEQVAEPT